MVVKKAVGAAMSSNKGSVKDAVIANALLMSVLKTDIHSLDEHAIDSIAVGYAFLKNFGEVKLC
jgi:hypothetical protein